MATFGTYGNDHMKKLVLSILREPNLTLETPIDTGTAAESAKAEIVLYTHYTELVMTDRKMEAVCSMRNSRQRNMCNKCGKSHQPQECPA